MSKEAIAALEAQIAQIKEEDSRAAQAVRDATPLEWRFKVEPDHKQGLHEEMWNTGLSWYRVTGHIANKEACKAAGWPDHMLEDGKGMTYLYDPLRKKVIMTTGGGTVYITGRKWAWSRSQDADEMQRSAQRAIATLGRFIAAHPEGGDITHIIETHQKEVGR